MSWLRGEAYDHEGWVANVLADGRVASSSTGSRLVIRELTADDSVAEREIRLYTEPDYLDVVIPWDQVTTWRATCRCGWTGTEWPAYADPTNGTRTCPEEIENRVFVPSWKAHVVLFELDELTNQLHALKQRITEKVQYGRSAGASWTQIGRAAGVSKQGAQQRWGA